MSLFFNLLSRLVITLLPRSKRHLISWLQLLFAVILEPKKIKSVTVRCFTLLFHFHQKALLFFPSAISIVSSVSLRLLFLPVILISPCASPSPALLMMYSAYKLNKQGQYTALTYSFPYLEAVCSMFSAKFCFLTCIQISQEAGQVVWYFHLLKNFPRSVVSHMVKVFGIIHKVDIDVFSGSLLLFQ